METTVRCGTATIEAEVETMRDRLLKELPVRERTSKIAGVTTSLLEGGQGPPLVLLHGGIQGGGLVWWRAIPRLVSGYRVVVPDLPGLGESESRGSPLDTAWVETWLEELIRLTCEEAPTLVAHSAPAALATRFAIRRSDQISRLVLMDAGGLARSRPPLSVLVAAIRSVARPKDRSFDQFMRKVMYDLGSLQEDEDQWSAFAEYVVSRSSLPTAKATMRAVVRFGLRPIPEGELRQIAIPVSLIWGRHDPLLPLPLAEAASRTFGWPLHVVEAAGHLPHVEQPDAFVRAFGATTDEVQSTVLRKP